MNVSRIILVLAAAIGLLGTGYCCYSASDSQLFRVTVPGSISIVAPPAPPIQTYTTGNSNIAFPRQDWQVSSNSLAGATVVFETASCFQNTLNSAMKRDARLSLRVNSYSGAGLWAVTRATDTTNYGTGDEDARVQVISNATGGAELGLTVTFLTGIGADLEEGDYTLTMVGTITSN